MGKHCRNTLGCVHTEKHRGVPERPGLDLGHRGQKVFLEQQLEEGGSPEIKDAGEEGTFTPSPAASLPQTSLRGISQAVRITQHQEEMSQAGTEGHRSAL